MVAQLLLFTGQSRLIATEGIDALSAKIEANPQERANYIQLAELLFYECYWIAAATDVAERLLEVEPGYYPIRKLIIQMGYRYPYLKRHQLHYEALVSQQPDDSNNWHYYRELAKTHLRDRDLIKRLELREAAYLKNAKKKK